MLVHLELLDPRTGGGRVGRARDQADGHVVRDLVGHLGDRVEQLLGAASAGKRLECALERATPSRRPFGAPRSRRRVYRHARAPAVSVNVVWRNPVVSPMPSGGAEQAVTGSNGSPAATTGGGWPALA